MNGKAPFLTHMSKEGISNYNHPCFYTILPITFENTLAPEKANCLALINEKKKKNNYKILILKTTAESQTTEYFLNQILFILNHSPNNADQ